MGMGGARRIAAAGTLSHIPQRHYIIILSLSAGAIKTHFFISNSAPKHVPLIFAASVCATFHTVFLVPLHTLTASSTSCSISDTACSYTHYACRVQQVRAGAISGTELSHNILLYFKFHMVAGEHHGVGSASSSVPQAGGSTSCVVEWEQGGAPAYPSGVGT